MDNHEFKQQLAAYLAENFIAKDRKEDKHRLKLSKLYYCERKINFDKIFAKNKGETFSEMLTRLVEESGEKNSAIYNRAQIGRQLFSKIKRNQNYQPAKDTAVALALALKLDISDAKKFLASAGYALSNSSKRDVIISFFLENKIFDTALLNDSLHEYNQPVLFDR